MSKLALGKFEGSIAWLDDNEKEPQVYLIANINDELKKLEISFAVPKEADIYKGIYKNRGDGPPYKNWTYRGYKDDKGNYCSMRDHPENEHSLCFWRMDLDASDELLTKNITPIAESLGCLSEVEPTVKRIRDLLDFPQNQLTAPYNSG